MTLELIIFFGLGFGFGLTVANIFYGRLIAKFKQDLRAIELLVDEVERLILERPL